MPVFQKDLNLRTTKKNEALDITDLIKRTVAEVDVASGICSLFVPHTTSAIIANEHFDPNVPSDILRNIKSLVANEGPWDHPEENAPAHVRASLFPSSLTIPIVNSALTLGQWQGLYFLEFDGPRTRRLVVTVMY